ncbi:MAG: ATP-dependent metallopeptidase FtsH/Yme1/Tma family protein, partial [Kurthia sp.]
MNRIFRYTIFYLLIFLVIIGIFGTFSGGKSPTKEINYHEFLSALDKNEITSATIQPDKLVYIVEGKMSGYEKDETFTVNIPRENQSLMDRIDAAAKDKKSNITYLAAPETSGWIQFFTGI